MVFANRVVACSEAARAEGVECGLRRRQAESRCPGIVVVADDPGRDARAFEPVVAAVEAFTPGVEIVRPGVCAFVTRGPSRYFGGDASLAAKVARAVDAVLAGTTAGAPRCRVGVADGRLAAELAALSSRGEPVIVARGGSRAFLADFPIAVDTGAATAGDADRADLLVRLGIRTLGDLAALPLPAVLARFGTDGAMSCRRARGLDGLPLAARTPPPDLAVTAELDPPVDRLETIAFLARSLAEQLHLALATRGLAATRVLVEAETEHGEWLARRWRHEGGLTPSALAERVRWQIEGWLAGRSGAAADVRPAGDVGAFRSPGDRGAPKTAADRPSGGLVLLRLTPDEVGPDDGRQLGFWGGDRAAAERVARALARVQGVLGPESVVTATLTGGRGPFEQARLVPWGDALSEAAGRHPFAEGAAVPPWPGRIPPPAPATVHPVPRPAEVFDAAGGEVTVTGRATVSAPPARLTVAGQAPADVVAWAGPWPVDERWWDPAAHRRRARSQVVTADGAAYLLVVEGGRWAVEAAYD
ncbi:MAG: protein ImuB [Actinomycetota bacterium]|nr:protein ImuB [Actinomycetota bacterium]